MRTIEIADQIIQYTIRYENRKSIQLKITGINQLTLTAPLRTPDSALEKVLQDKRHWLSKNMLRYQQLAENPLNQSLLQDSKLLFMGECYLLRVAESSGHASGVRCQDNLLIVTPAHSADPVEQLLKQWYVQQAAKVLSERTEFWSRKIGVQPKRIVIKDQKTRWGSCSSLANINYNWRIIMAPVTVIDYLVVHELCHLKIPNHSLNFWQLVGKHIPAYAACRSWLKLNGTLLSRQF